MKKCPICKGEGVLPKNKMKISQRNINILEDKFCTRLTYKQIAERYGLSYYRVNTLIIKYERRIFREFIFPLSKK